MNNDLLIANLDEMELFLLDAIKKRDELNSNMNKIIFHLSLINNWDDQVLDKTKEVIYKIQTQINLITDQINDLNKKLDEYIDNLNDYNNINKGLFGRL